MKRFLRRALRYVKKVSFIIDITDAFIDNIFQLNRERDPRLEAPRKGGMEDEAKEKGKKKKSSPEG